MIIAKCDELHCCHLLRQNQLFYYSILFTRSYEPWSLFMALVSCIVISNLRTFFSTLIVTSKFAISDCRGAPILSPLQVTGFSRWQRWYRAPEIMLSFKMYTKVSIWITWTRIPCSCYWIGDWHLVGRMHPGRTSYQETIISRQGLWKSAGFDPWFDWSVCPRMYFFMVHQSLRPTGTPSIGEVNAITSRRSQRYIRKLPFRPKRNFESLFPYAQKNAIDFLLKTLVRCTFC